MTAKGASRGLTFGEIALAASVFGGRLDPTTVRFHRRKWWPLQPRAIVMAPRGSIWFHPESPDWREDFSREPLSLRAFIVHELTHVWQHQNGVNLILRRLPLARYDYLPLTPRKQFKHYGLEQQAEIVRHAYILREGGQVNDAPPLPTYASLLPFGDWRPTRRAAAESL